MKTEHIAIAIALFGAGVATSQALSSHKQQAVLSERMEVGTGPVNALIITLERRIGAVRGFDSIEQCDAWSKVAKARSPSLAAVVCLPPMPRGKDEGNTVLPTLKEAGL